MKTLLARLWPTRIAAQLAALVVLSTILIQGLVAASFHLLRPDPGADGMRAVATVVRLLADAAPGDERRRRFADIAASFPELAPDLRPTAPPLLETDPARGPGFGLGPGPGFEPGRHMAAEIGRPVRIARLAGPGDDPGRHRFAFVFADGETAVLAPGRPPPPFFDPAWAGVAFAALSIAVLALWAMRALVVPLRALAAAAVEFDIEGEPRPLPDAGPEEVRIASRAFDAMRARIRALVEDRTRMLAAMGHDLRTPITRLRLRSEFLSDDGVRADHLRDLALMNDMIDGALTYLREGRHREPAVLVDVAVLLATLCDQAGDLGHAVTYVGPDHLSRRLRNEGVTRAFANLIDNATKYGTTVTVRLVARDGGCRVEIDDDGPGIAPAEREAMQRPFVRGDAARNLDGARGFGLGLAIVRAVVDGHGGRLTLDEAPGGGLRVVVDLPG